jgi:hypothetical protein
MGKTTGISMGNLTGFEHTVPAVSAPLAPERWDSGYCCRGPAPP